MFKDFMARFRDWHEANKRGQKRTQPWGVHGRVYEKRPEPPAPSRAATARTEATFHLTIIKKNGDKIFVSKLASGTKE